MNTGMQLIVDKKKLLVGRPIYINFCIVFHGGEKYEVS